MEERHILQMLDESLIMKHYYGSHLCSMQDLPYSASDWLAVLVDYSLRLTQTFKTHNSSGNVTFQHFISCSFALHTAPGD